MTINQQARERYGLRLAKRRKESGFTQEALGRNIWPQSTTPKHRISKAERGLWWLASNEERKAEKVLDVPRGFFRKQPIQADRPIEFLTLDGIFARRVVELEPGVRECIRELPGSFEDSLFSNPLRLKSVNYSNADEQAEALRVAWGLGDAPIADLRYELESRRVAVFLSAHIALPPTCVAAGRSGDLSFIVVQKEFSKQGMATRYKMSLALGHLLFCRGPECPTIEVIRKFARHFLIPDEGMNPFLRRPKLAVAPSFWAEISYLVGKRFGAPTGIAFERLKERAPIHVRAEIATIGPFLENFSEEDPPSHWMFGDAEACRHLRLIGESLRRVIR